MVLLSLSFLRLVVLTFFSLFFFLLFLFFIFSYKLLVVWTFCWLGFESTSKVEWVLFLLVGFSWTAKRFHEVIVELKKN